MLTDLHYWIHELPHDERSSIRYFLKVTQWLVYSRYPKGLYKFHIMRYIQWNVYEKKTTRIIIYINILSYDHSSKQTKCFNIYLHKNFNGLYKHWTILRSVRKINLNSPNRKFKKNLCYAIIAMLLSSDSSNTSCINNKNISPC